MSEKKEYRLSDTSTQFRGFLVSEGITYRFTDDHKAVFVKVYCDTDLFDLGKKYQNYLNTNVRPSTKRNPYAKPE